MGCVSSKHLKKQALLEDHKWAETSPRKKKPFHKPSNSELSFEHYHCHKVALSSSSYGVLKVDTPKTSDHIKKSTARAGSMNDLYERLNLFESMDSAPESWDEVSTVLQTLKPGFQRSISIPVPRSSRPLIQETINVSDIMQGLEERASGSSSPSQDARSDKLQAPPPPPVPEKLMIRRHKSHDKMTSCQDKNLGSGMPHCSADFIKRAGFMEKFPMSSPESMSSESMNAFSAHTAMPLPHQYKDQPSSMQTSINGACYQDRHTLTKTTSVPNQSMQSFVEDRSLCKDSKPLSGTTSSRKVKITLNLEYERTLITDMPMGQDVCYSAGSSERRSTVDALTEPDSPLFDPALIASYERALQELRKENWSIADDTNDLYEKEKLTRETQMDLDTTPTLHIPEDCQSDSVEALDEAITMSSVVQSLDPLNEFDWKCPLGGEETVVLYTTTLRGISKTFEDCNKVRDILKGFSVGFYERDISMHATYRNELTELLGGRVSVPSLFIKGRDIGGVDDVRRLHEEGKLFVLLKGLPKDLNTGVCDGCGDIRFIPCLACSGSCKIVDQTNNTSRCLECNENGLIQCPICSKA